MLGEFGPVGTIVGAILVFLLFLLILAAVIYCFCGGGCWSGRGKGGGNKCGKKGGCGKDGCCPKQAYLSKHGTGVITLFQDANIGVYEMTFNDAGLARPCGPNKEQKCPPKCDKKQWKPVFSDIDPTALVGYTVPQSGNYWIEYHLGMITNGSIGLVLVNGVPVADSTSWSLDLAETPAVCGRQLNKSFMLHLKCGDIVNVIVYTFILPNFFIDGFYDEGNFKFLSTFAAHLQDPDDCNDCCRAPTGGSVPPVQPADPLCSPSIEQQLFPVNANNPVIQKFEAFAELVNTTDVDPALIVSQFLACPIVA